MDQSQSEENMMFEQLHHTLTKDLYDEVLSVDFDDNKKQVKEIDTSDVGAEIDFSLWNDIEDDQVEGEQIKGVHCIKT
jgi:hypothetical protein